MSEANRPPQPGWYKWTPEVAADPRNAELANGVREFRSERSDAGREAARWLREDALEDHPNTVTYLLWTGVRVDGYFALASGSVELAMDDRLEFTPPGSEYLPPPVLGASHIEWLARNDQGDTPGHDILLYALSVAMQVADLQGTPVAVLDPYDKAVAELCEGRYGFRRSQTRAGNDVRLWLTLDLLDLA